MTHRADVAVIGGGILGLAFAWESARRGKSVVLFERDDRAQGASVRNFGMAWPVGQPAGARYATALRSRARWLDARDRGGLWAAECGSLHLAYRADELAVLDEFAALAPANGIDCRLVTAAEAASLSPGVNPAGLLAALHSPTELCVDPRQAIATLPGFLQREHGVDVRFGTAVAAVDMPHARTAGGETWRVETAFVCGGADFATLFPEVFAGSGLRRCKLQMMRTRPQPGGWRLGPHLAGGLTLCHYAGFAVCDSLAALRARVAAEFPEYVRYGIHVMASQNHLGEVVIGDSHEYDADVSPFDRPEIDELILGYLCGMLRMPDWSVAGRWHGLYVKHPTRPIFAAEPQPGCHVMTGVGGAGMTMSFGLAGTWWEARADGQPPPADLFGDGS
jgi:FAD dependent oxidoreductase TIGR03364